MSSQRIKKTKSSKKHILEKSKKVDNNTNSSDVTDTKSTSDSTTADLNKKFYLCMVKQIQGSSKSEAKIYITENPKNLLITINSQEHVSSNENNTHGMHTKSVSLISTKSKSKRKSRAKKKKIQTSDQNSTDADDDDDEDPAFSTELKSKDVTPNSGRLSADRNGSIFWNIELIIGKFDKTAAKQYAKMWDNISRGINSRRERGLEVFQTIREKDPTVVCYDKALLPIDPNFNSWLEMLKIAECALPDNCLCKIDEILYRAGITSNLTLNNYNPGIVHMIAAMHKFTFTSCNIKHRFQ